MNPRTPVRAVALTAAGLGLATLALPATLAGASPRAHSGRDDLVARANGHASFVAQGHGHGLFFGADAGHAARRPSDIPASAAPAAAARGWLAHYPTVFRHTGSLDATSTTHVRGGAIVRLQQHVGGLPVVAGQVVVALDGDNNLLSVAGATTPTATVDATPRISADSAARLAIRSIGRHRDSSSLRAATPTLSVLDTSLIGGGPSLATPGAVWATTVTSTDGALRHQVFVDATRGSVVLDINANSQVKRVVCQAVDGADSLVMDPTCSSGTARSDELQVVADDSNVPTSSDDADTFNAYRFAGAVYDFYKTLLGRDSINGNGGELDSTVHFCDANDPSDCPMQNAFWDGHEMVYGSSYASALDVVGHEMTHGVTEKTSNLFSYYQSGAINESISDVMGEMIQQIEGPGLTPSAYAGTPWLVGEDLPIGAVRNMANPTQDSPADPDRMTSAHYNAYRPWDDFFDSGGVHANAGVGNKAAYLIAAGPNGDGTSGTFDNVTMTGVSGADQIERDVKVANIYYRLDQLMSSGASYADVYNLLPQACRQLVGQQLPMPAGSTSATTSIVTADCTQVSLAVKATQMNLQPTAGGAKIPAASPTCTNGGSATRKRLDTFEASNPLVSGGPYQRSHSTAKNTTDYPWATTEFGQWWWSKSRIGDYGGVHLPPFQDQGSLASLWGDDADPYSASPDPDHPSHSFEDASVAMARPLAARVGTYVRFNHAWEFDYSPYFDNNGNPISSVKYFDGGRVEYSVDGGKHWYDAGAPSAVSRKALLVNGGYNGRITNTSDSSMGYIDPNPLRGRHAFVGSSHGWTSSRLDLSSLNGKRVLLRWRIAADDFVGSLGWYVDNVYAFSCNPTHITLAAPTAVHKGRKVPLTAHVTRTGTTTVVANVPVQLWFRKHGTSTWTKFRSARLTNTRGNVSWAPTQRVRTDYRVRMMGKKPFAPSNITARTVGIS